jgi:hypothetical protein
MRYVIAGLDPAIPMTRAQRFINRDARIKSAHDGNE